METYHRKRSKRSAINANNDMMSLKRQETAGSLLEGALRKPPPLARQVLLDTNCDVADVEEVEVGSVYEIYHQNLPPRTPVQLMCTRVVMVSEKTDLNVGIRYPSGVSLRTYFSGIKEMYPALDEKFVMGTMLARKVLLRQVPSKEFAEKKHLVCFWLVNPGSQYRTNVEETGLAKELKKSMITWGVRRQVMFIQRDKELSNTQSSSSFVQGEGATSQQQIDIYAPQKDEEIEEEAEEEVEHANSTRILRKRKKGKQVNHLWQVNRKPMKKCKKLAITKDPTDRWSKERYMAAELSLLEAMKEKKAMIGNPITRPALRVEARKRIGDTGLLDHLLKHVANKVAPGGELRFRRSHNADGAMEYWLEDANLLKIRKDAGVSDPFWIPPPGWKPGDSPIQDPIVAKEINNLKEEIANMKRDQDISKKQAEEEIANLKREIQDLTSNKKQDKSGAIVAYEPVDSNPKQHSSIFNLMLHSESEISDDDVANSIFQREISKKDIFDLLKKLQALLQQAEVKETSTQMDVESRKQAGTELITATVVSGDQKESQKQNPKVAHKNVTPVPPPAPAGDQKLAPGETSGRAITTAGGPPPPPPPPPPPEGKAAKIERLKSGFRICRPQGTFLWPNMVNSTTTTTTTTNMSSSLLVVPTPPSVNSSTPPQPLYHHHHHHPSPVRPVPEKRPITVSPPPATTIINLNHIPTNSSSSELKLSTPTTIEPVEAGARYKKLKISSSSSLDSTGTRDLGGKWLNDAHSVHV